MKARSNFTPITRNNSLSRSNLTTTVFMAAWDGQRWLCSSHLQGWGEVGGGRMGKHVHEMHTRAFIPSIVSTVGSDGNVKPNLNLRFVARS